MNCKCKLKTLKVNLIHLDESPTGEGVLLLLALKNNVGTNKEQIQHNKNIWKLPNKQR